MWNHDGTLYGFVPFAHGNVTGKVKINTLHVDWNEKDNFVGVRSFDLAAVNTDKTIQTYTSQSSVPGGWPAQVGVINSTKSLGWLFTDSLGELDSAFWNKSSGLSNGGMFNAGGSANNVSSSNGVTTLTINDTASSDKPYSSGVFRTNQFYGYGRYEVRMKPAKVQGTVSAFFTYTNSSEFAGDPWDEIDIEFLGKDTTKLQLNYFKGGTGGHEKVVDLGFDASSAYHDYAFEWTPTAIRWFVDNKLVHTVTGTTATLPSHEMRIFANLWPAVGVDDWTGKFTYPGTPVKAYYESISFTPLKQGQLYTHSYSGGDKLVIENTQGAKMTRLDSTGKQVWQQAAHTFTENVAILDPSQSPVKLVGREKSYTLDIASGTWVATSTNDGSDTRRVDDQQNFPMACTHARQITSGTYKGTQLVTYTGMYADQQAHSYVIEDGKMRFVESHAKASRGWSLDSAGTLWSTKDGKLQSRKWNGTGYSAITSTSQPSPFTGTGEDGVQRVHYDPSTDTVVLSGYKGSSDRKNKGSDETGLAGTVVAVFDKWSTSDRKLRWQADLKTVTSTFYDGSKKSLLPISMTVTDQYVWFGSVFRDTDSDSAPMLYGYRLRDGTLLHQVHAGQYRDLRSGWLDLPCGITGRTLANGEDLLIQEDNGWAQLLVWRVPAAK